MGTTIRDVAAAAGVSVATASRALSGSSAVVQETKDRVLDAAERLAYTPSRVAQSLVTGSTGNIGVILPDVTNTFYVSFLAGLESTLAPHEFCLLIGDSGEDSSRELELLRRMRTQVDGVVLASSRLEDREIVSTAKLLHVVLANRLIEAEADPRTQLSQIALDAKGGFIAAVEHLHGLGHSAITYLDGPRLSWSASQKRTVLSEACETLGMSLTIVGSERADFDAGRAAWDRVKTHSSTAVITFNDQLALGILSACRDTGVSVPHDISVVGCDDSLPEGLAWPSLTTVDSSAYELGEATAQAILDPGAYKVTSIKTALVVRASSGSAPSRDTA